MTAYYYMVSKGENVKLDVLPAEKWAAQLADRKSDFPVIQIAAVEDGRLDVLKTLFATWSNYIEVPIVCRVDDAGTLEAWLRYEA